MSTLTNITENLKTPEGTMEFVSTPISIGSKKTNLVDLTSPRNNGRILLSLEMADSNIPMLELKACSPKQELFSKGKLLTKFQIGQKLNFVLTWSSHNHEVIVYIDGEEFLRVENSNIEF